MHLCCDRSKHSCGNNHFRSEKLQKELILTLIITIIIEGIIAAGYCIWHKKPLGPILVTSVLANLITQSFLWIGLSVFFSHYLAVLGIAEILIWIIEAVLIYLIPYNQLRFADAILLSLLLNAISFGIGWFLPI